MYKLKNGAISLEIIDPKKDSHLLGSRYCCGGYIFQIEDAAKGCVLSGPTFGSGSFNTFDGQGAPEVFLNALCEEKANLGDLVLVPGVGTVIRTSDIMPFHARNNPNVKEFAAWDVAWRPQEFEARTRQVFDGYDVDIVRRVSLEERRVISATTFSNHEKPINLRWFPHPFFPPAACLFVNLVAVPDNPGYFINEQGWVEQKPDYDWSKGLYQPLTIIDNTPFHAVVKHPAIGNVDVSCDYAPSFLPVWANSRTLSFEPYLEKTVAAGESASWKTEYSF
jgi:hypothetical protein